MRNTFTKVLWAVGLTVGLSAGAQARLERAQDRRELRQDRRETRDDRRDLLQVEVLLERFDAARATRRPGQLVELDGQLRELVRRELAEGRFELAKDSAELARSNREVRRDEVSVAVSRGDGVPGDTALARGALADDRHDRRDDRRDLRQEEMTQTRRREIAAELNGIAGRVDPVALSRRRELMVAWRDLAVRELGQDRRERREDHRELREDRR